MTICLLELTGKYTIDFYSFLTCVGRLSPIFCLFAVEKAALSSFSANTNAQTQGAFVGGKVFYTSTAHTAEPIYKGLVTLHEALLSGKAVWNPPKTGKKGKEKAAASNKEDGGVTSTLIQELLPNKEGVPRWNGFRKATFLKFMTDNLETLHVHYKGKWSEVTLSITKTIAVEVIWGALADHLGFNKAANFEVDFVKHPSKELFLREEGLVLKEIVRPLVPQSLVEVSYFDWGALLLTVDADEGDDIIKAVLDTLVSHVVGADKKLHKNKENKAVHTDHLLVATNTSWRDWLVKVKKLLFQTHRTSTGQDRAAVMGGNISGFGEMTTTADADGFYQYKRWFPPLELVQVKEKNKDQDKDDSDEEVDTRDVAGPSQVTKKAAKFHYVRNIENAVAGPTVKVLFVQADCFDLTGGFLPASIQHGSTNGLVKNMSICFADPPWGVNLDRNQFGGIDLKEERWSTCVFVLAFLCLGVYFICVGF